MVDDSEIQIDNRNANAGGSRAARGISFQAEATAFAIAHVLAGRRLNWLERVTEDIPTVVFSESGGAGDDIRISLRNGSSIEIQAKRGLRRGKHLWRALERLAAGVAVGQAEFGVLLVCPKATTTITEELAIDLIRMGDGRLDHLSPIGDEFRQRLDAMKLPIATCANLRVQVLSAGPAYSDAIRSAEASLTTLLQNPADAHRAWNALVRDAELLIAERGVRTIESALRVLDADGVPVRCDHAEQGPAVLLRKLINWVEKTNAAYFITGIATPVALDTGWLVQYAQPFQAEQPELSSAKDSLEAYRDVSTAHGDAVRLHGSTIGRFIKRCVVLAGPGMGKTTLLAKLARTYARDGSPVLKVRLRALLARMRSSGAGFEEAVFALGCANSGILPDLAKRSGFAGWTLLCDGLDECGADRPAVAKEIADFAAGHPEARIILTSRSIGYQSGPLKEWRHYKLLALSKDDLRRAIEQILCATRTVFPDRVEVDKLHTILSGSPALPTIAATPLLLGLALALALRDGSVGQTEADLYQRIFEMVEASAGERIGEQALSHVELVRAVDLIGYSLVMQAAESAESTLTRVAEQFAKDFSCSPFEARRRCEIAKRYWCEIGLLEEVQHQGTAMLAFVHKTFGEFACARCIRDASSREQLDLLRKAVNLQADPVVDFAAALGLARKAFQTLLDEDQTSSAETVERALALANHGSEEELSDLLQSVVERAFDHMTDINADQAGRLGQALLNLVPSHRQNAAKIAFAYRGAASREARLAAWCLLLDTDFDEASLKEVTAAVLDLTPSDGAEQRKRKLAGDVIARHPASGLFQTFAVKVADRLLGEANAEMDALALRLLRAPGLDIAGFVSKIEPVLTRHARPGVEQQMRQHWFGDRPLSLDGQFDHEAYEKAAAICDKAQMEALAVGAPPDPRRTAIATSVLPSLSAFRAVLDWGRFPASDVWHWQDRDWRPIEREVMWTAAHLAAADTNEIARDASALLATREEVRGIHSFAFLERTDVVDVPATDWARVKDLSFDRKKVELGLHHGSEYIVNLAANILDQVVAGEDRRALVARLYEHGTSFTLWAAVELARALEAEDALELTLRRLSGKCCYGLEHLFRLFTTFRPQDSPPFHSMFAETLLAARPEVAIAAAEAAQLSLVKHRYLDILTTALRHWEENPPRRRGVRTPPDPCREIKKAIVALTSSEPASGQIASSA